MAAEARRGARGESGAVLVMAVLLLLLLSIFVPLMVLVVQRESRWAGKNSQNMDAFHLAEAGVEKGYRAITTSTATWYNLINNGTGVTNFLFDHTFNDVSNGTYTVGISSGPQALQATVVAIGREAHGKEVRGIRAVYGQNAMGSIAIQSIGGVTVSGGVSVEWGAIISQNQIDTGNRTSPQYHSAAGLINQTNYPYLNDPTSYHCDQLNCCQLFSFDPDTPGDPGVDLNFYRSSAQATTAGCPSGGVNGSCYFNTAQSWTSITYSGGSTIFVENNLTVGSPGVDIQGSLVVTGNFTTTSGGWGKGSATMSLPIDAWKQYCNNWSTYQGWDSYANANMPTFPGLNSTYTSNPTYTYAPTPNSKFAVQGFMYVGGTFSTSGGGGNAFIYGLLVVQGTVTIASNSGVTVYYNRNVSNYLHTTKVIVNRVSWQDVMAK